MFRGFRLIPRLEKWDFNKLFVDKNLYNFINKRVYTELQVTKKNNIKIPYKYQWESRDFYKKNAK